MNVSCKYRIHMGCGEPLQSRWRVTQSRRPLLAGDQDARNSHPPKSSGGVRRGAKCKL